MTALRKPTNPLLTPRNEVALGSGPTQLDAHCAMLNDMAWVRDSGKPYRIITGPDGRRTLAR